MFKDWAFWWEFIQAVGLIYGPILVILAVVGLLVRWLYNRCRLKFDILKGESFTEATNETIAEKFEEMRSELDQYRSPREKDLGGQLPRDPDGPGGGWSSHHGRLDGESGDPS